MKLVGRSDWEWCRFPLEDLYVNFASKADPEFDRLENTMVYTNRAKLTVAT